MARSQVRRAAASTQPRLRPRGDSVARARRRRQHRDLPAARCRAHSHAAGREPAAARRASDCRYQGRPHGTVHRTPADAHLSALRADPRSPAGVRRTGRVGHDVVQPDAQRRSAVRAGDLGERRVLQHARREGDARPHAERRRRRPRLRVARRRRQLRILAARARRRSIGDWSRARSRGSRVSDRWGGAAAVLRDGSRPYVRRRGSVVRRAAHARAERPRQTGRLVPRPVREVEGGMDDRAGHGASGGDLAADFSADVAPALSTRGHEELPRVQARGVSGRHRRVVAPARLRGVAVAAARDDGPRARHRVREPREPAPRARDRARARDRGPPRHRRVARPDRSSTARREPPAVGDRRRWRTVDRAVAQSVSRRLPAHRLEPHLRRSDDRLARVRVHRRFGRRHVPDLRTDAGDSRDVDRAGRRDEGGEPRIDRFARTLRSPPQPRGRAGRALARPRRRRAAVRPEPAESHAPRRRLPPGWGTRREPRPARVRYRRAGPPRRVRGVVGAAAGAARRRRRGRSVHRPGQWIGLEQPDRDRRRRAHPERQLQRGRTRVLPHHGDADAGGP